MADPENGLMNGEHLDEGVVHAWLDGQLTAADAARIESHIAGCADCAAMVAEARGFMAASSRILTGLDGVPARVVLEWKVYSTSVTGPTSRRCSKNMVSMSQMIC